MQPHILHCEILNSYLKSEDIIKEKVKYDDIFGETKKQKVIVTIFSEILDIRKMLLSQQTTTHPSILDEMLKKHYNLQTRIVNVSFGN